jgi:hypothetical protein
MHSTDFGMVVYCIMHSNVFVWFGCHTVVEYIIMFVVVFGILRVQ